jgi:hypothetical protein
VKHFWNYGEWVEDTKLRRKVRIHGKEGFSYSEKGFKLEDKVDGKRGNSFAGLGEVINT